MDTKQLKYFLALAQQEHMSLTAEFLNITQPALSKSIRNLEQELGVELFDRFGNRIRLNQWGREFAEYVDRSMSSLETGVHLLHQTRYEMRGRIKISCRAFVDGIIDCVSEYMRLNPQIHVYLFQSTQSNTINFVEQTDFFLSAYNDISHHEDMLWLSQPLFQEEYYILISPRYRTYPDSVSSISAAELKDDWFIADYFSVNLFQNADPLTRMCSYFGYDPKVRFHTEDFPTKIHMVDEGFGITMLPYSCLRVAKKLAPDVRAFAIRDYPSVRTVSLFRKREVQMTEAGLDFWTFAKDFYSKHDK